MDDLVAKLSKGKHQIDFEPRTQSVEDIQQRLECGHVLIKFMDTVGFTELGLKVDPQLTCLDAANFDISEGEIRLVGYCKLNFQDVKCCAQIDLATRQGFCQLELV